MSLQSVDKQLRESLHLQSSDHFYMVCLEGSCEAHECCPSARYSRLCWCLSSPRVSPPLRSTPIKTTPARRLLRLNWTRSRRNIAAELSLSIPTPPCPLSLQYQALLRQPSGSSPRAVSTEWAITTPE